VRARNVLRRWAAAQHDPRLAWADPLAPLGNLELVAGVFVTLWQANADDDAVVELGADDLDELWGLWFRPFVGTGIGDGWLDRSDLDDDAIAAAFAGDLAAAVTALCWLAIRPGPDRRSRLVTWKPYLRATFNRGLISSPDDDIAEYLTAVGYAVDTDQVETDFLEALDFMDDALWCQQLAAEYGFDSVRLELPAAGQATSLRLDIRGVEHPLYDPRVPAAIVAARRYRSADAVAAFGRDRDWRVVVSTGEPVLFKAGRDAPLVESDMPLAASVLEELVASTGVLGDLFSVDVRVA
jgi:hypothetical protein